MYQKSSMDAPQKKIPGLKLKPGVFSDPNNFIAKQYQEEMKKQGRGSQKNLDISGRRDRGTTSSFENVYKVTTNMTSENDPMSSIYDNAENYGQEYVFNNDFSGLKPLEERSNIIPSKLSLGEKGMHARSDKLPSQCGENQRNMRRQSSFNSLQKRPYSRNPNDQENKSTSEIENRENSSNLRVLHASQGVRSKGSLNFISHDNDPYRGEKKFSRTRSVGKIQTQHENTNFRTPDESMMAYMEEKEEQVKVQNLMQENIELWNNIKRLSAELQNERNKSCMLENEVNSLNASISEERAKYQEEFIKISQEIKRFQNIQNAYVKEKKTSQALEQQINVQEKALGDLCGFLKDCFQTMIKELEMIILKGDVAFEKLFRNQEFASEDFFKFCYELKKPLLQKLEIADKQNFKFEWKTNDYDQLLRYSKELEKLRKAQDFKIAPSKFILDDIVQKSPVNIASQSNRLSISPALPQTTSSRWSSGSRNTNNARSNHTSYRSIDNHALVQNQDLNKSDLGNYSHNESQQKQDKYIPLNCRVNLTGFSLHPPKEYIQESAAKEKDTTDLSSQNFMKKRAVSVPRIYEADSYMQENNRSKFSGAQETFDSLLMDGIHSKQEPEHEMKNTTEEEEDNNDQYQYQSYILNQEEKSNEFIQLSDQVNNGLELAQSQIISRMSSISDNKRRQSLEGVRQFNLDINKMSSQDFIHPDLITHGITEKSHEETTPRTRPMAGETYRGEENLQENEDTGRFKERLQSNEKSEGKSPVSGKGISWSPAPKLNLMAYNTNEENIATLSGSQAPKVNYMAYSTNEGKFATLADTDHALNTRNNEEFVPTESEDKSIPNESYRESNYRPNQGQSYSQSQGQQGSRAQGDYAIANYDYQAQKENDLSFNRGDRIQILKRTENGWWIGLSNNRIGYFPSNFVTLAQGDN